MHLQQEHVKDGVDSSFNLLNIIEYQAVLDDNGFERERRRPLST
jgi:hypothetical protein